MLLKRVPKSFAAAKRLENTRGHRIRFPHWKKDLRRSRNEQRGVTNKKKKQKREQRGALHSSRIEAFLLLYFHAPSEEGELDGTRDTRKEGWRLPRWGRKNVDQFLGFGKEGEKENRSGSKDRSRKDR